MFLLNILSYSQDSLKVVPRFTDEDIEINYLKGTESDNFGLKISSAYHLGERKSQKAVIPLMDALRSDSSAEVRIWRHYRSTRSVMKGEYLQLGKQ